MTELSEQGADRGIQNYRSGIRGTVRGLWNATFSWEQSWEILDLVIRSNWQRAFNDGARSVGVQPAEQTPEERLKLRQDIARETSYIAGLLDAVEQGSKANGGKLTPLYNRVELWVQRYQQVYTDGQMTAREDPKFKWIRTAQEGCIDCLNVENKVKRKSQWERAGWQPQAHSLA